MIHARAEATLAAPPQEVFAFIDDLEKTPQWNARCVSVSQVSDGARAVGSKLRYRYKEGSRAGEMDGEVTAYEKPKRLTMRYVDKMMRVDVAFELAAEGSGTRLVHHVEIEPRSFFIKLMQPLIRGATRKQTDGVVGKLKELLGSPGGS